MTFLLLFGVVVIIIIALNKDLLSEWISRGFLVRRLSRSKWIENHWQSGIILFLINAVLFGSALGLLTLISYLMIPFAGIFIMMTATAASIYIWLAFRAASKRGKKQLLSWWIGSSFYFLLVIVFGIMLVSLEPSTPENDTFMAAVGLTFAIIVSLVAFVTCFWITCFNSEKSGYAE